MENCSVLLSTLFLAPKRVARAPTYPQKTGNKQDMYLQGMVLRSRTISAATKDKNALIKSIPVRWVATSFSSRKHTI